MHMFYTSLFSVNSVVTVIMSFEDYILKIYGMVMILSEDYILVISSKVMTI